MTHNRGLPSEHLAQVSVTRESDNLNGDNSSTASTRSGSYAGLCSSLCQITPDWKLCMADSSTSGHSCGCLVCVSLAFTAPNGTALKDFTPILNKWRCLGRCSVLPSTTDICSVPGSEYSCFRDTMSVSDGDLHDGCALDFDEYDDTSESSVPNNLSESCSSPLPAGINFSLTGLNKSQTSRIMKRAEQRKSLDQSRRQRMLYRPRMQTRRVQALGRERGSCGRFRRSSETEDGLLA